MRSRKLAMAALAGGALVGALGAGPARAALTFGDGSLVKLTTNDNQVVESCTAVTGEGGLYSWFVIANESILIKPGGPCGDPTPVPPLP